MKTTKVFDYKKWLRNGKYSTRQYDVVCGVHVLQCKLCGQRIYEWEVDKHKCKAGECK